ncbi:hypothetical protein FG05_35236 [Fusarium graminearum]|nr:hypothetical protein FG05_35236 [Fusarium graminearum]
MTAHDQE